MLFLASPYRTPDPTLRAWRYERALEFCATHLMNDPKRRPIYSPIVHWHPVAELNPVLHEQDTAFWMAQNRPMLEICDELWVLCLRGWRESEGVAAEIAQIEGYGRRVRRFLPQEQETAWIWERIA